MDITSLLIGLALLALVAFGVAYPFLARRGLQAVPLTPAERLLAERESVLLALRDLDFDHTVGKIPPDEYAAQRAELTERGVAVLKQLDALGLTSSANTVDEAIEQAVARRRQQLPAALTCGQCGLAVQAGDIFCGKCGAKLAEVPV